MDFLYKESKFVKILKKKGDRVRGFYSNNYFIEF